MGARSEAFEGEPAVARGRRLGPAQWAIAVLVLLALLSLAMPAARDEQSRSSFGTIPEGHGALFELLVSQGWSRGRSFSAYDALPRDATLWWVEPLGVCSSRIALSGEVDVLDSEAVAWPAAEWLDAGGRAVVWLQPADSEVAECDEIAGARLPRRVGAAKQVVEGAISPTPRQLDDASVLAFEQALDWEAAARIGERPFVVSRRVGEGLLVVVADAGFVHNARLGERDAAPLAVDLVRAYGIPRFDEREHGFIPETSAVRYLARSRAFPAFLGLALVGGLVVWRGNALPMRSVAELDLEAPTPEAFVASMASLYARTGDRERILERYRELCAARLRRHFAMPADLSSEALAERIVRLSRLDADAIARLLSKRVAAGKGLRAAELRFAMDELDRLVEEVTR